MLSMSKVATAAWPARRRASRATTRKVLKVHAPANQPVKKGDLLLEINPAPYQHTVNQAQAQLNVANANVEQAKAGLQAAVDNVAKARAGVAQAQAALDEAKAAVANAQATLNKVKAADELSRTEEQIALNLQKMDAGAISTLNDRVAYEFENEIDVTDLGLTLADVRKYGLEARAERCRFEGYFASDSLATREDQEYLRSGRRARLLALVYADLRRLARARVAHACPAGRRCRRRSPAPPAPFLGRSIRYSLPPAKSSWPSKSA
jgi:multidrug efflux pump subunit AcrA (membrane-fusion protein)